MLKKFTPPVEKLSDIEGSKKSSYSIDNLIAYAQKCMSEARTPEGRALYQKVLTQFEGLKSLGTSVFAVGNSAGAWYAKNLLAIASDELKLVEGLSKLNLKDPKPKADPDNTAPKEPEAPKAEEEEPNKAPEPEPEPDPTNEAPTLGGDKAEDLKAPKNEPVNDDTPIFKARPYAEFLSAEEFKQLAYSLSFGPRIQDFKELEKEQGYSLRFGTVQKGYHYDLVYKKDVDGAPRVSTNACMTLDQATDLVELSAATMGSDLRMTNPKMRQDDKDMLYVATQVLPARQIAQELLTQLSAFAAYCKKHEQLPPTAINPDGAVAAFLRGASFPSDIILRDGQNETPYKPTKDMSEIIAHEENRLRGFMIQTMKENANIFSPAWQHFIATDGQEFRDPAENATVSGSEAEQKEKITKMPTAGRRKGRRGPHAAMKTAPADTDEKRRETHAATDQRVAAKRMPRRGFVTRVKISRTPQKG